MVIIISNCAIIIHLETLFDHSVCSVRVFKLYSICLYCKCTFSFQFCGIYLKNRYSEDVREALLDKVACTDYYSKHSRLHNSYRHGYVIHAQEYATAVSAYQGRECHQQEL